MSPEKPSPPQYIHLRRAAYEGIKGIKTIKSMTNEKYDELSKETNRKIEADQQEYAVNYRRAKLY